MRQDYVRRCPGWRVSLRLTADHALLSCLAGFVFSSFLCAHTASMNPSKTSSVWYIGLFLSLSGPYVLSDIFSLRFPSSFLFQLAPLHSLAFVIVLRSLTKRPFCHLFSLNHHSSLSTTPSISFNLKHPSASFVVDLLSFLISFHQLCSFRSLHPPFPPRHSDHGSFPCVFA